MSIVWKVVFRLLALRVLTDVVSIISGGRSFVVLALNDLKSIVCECLKEAKRKRNTKTPKEGNQSTRQRRVGTREQIATLFKAGDRKLLFLMSWTNENHENHNFSDMFLEIERSKANLGATFQKENPLELNNHQKRMPQIVELS